MNQSETHIATGSKNGAVIRNISSGVAITPSYDGTESLPVRAMKFSPWKHSLLGKLWLYTKQCEAIAQKYVREQKGRVSSDNICVDNFWSFSNYFFQLWHWTMVAYAYGTRYSRVCTTITKLFILHLQWLLHSPPSITCSWHLLVSIKPSSCTMSTQKSKELF